MYKYCWVVNKQGTNTIIWEAKNLNIYNFL